MIKIVGNTADGEYPSYELEGELNDLNYRSPGLIWTPTDLLSRMVYLRPQESITATPALGVQGQHQSHRGHESTTQESSEILMGSSWQVGSF